MSDFWTLNLTKSVKSYSLLLFSPGFPLEKIITCNRCVRQPSIPAALTAAALPSGATGPDPLPARRATEKLPNVPTVTGHSQCPFSRPFSVHRALGFFYRLPVWGMALTLACN